MNLERATPARLVLLGTSLIVALVFCAPGWTQQAEPSALANPPPLEPAAGSSAEMVTEHLPEPAMEQPEVETPEGESPAANENAEPEFAPPVEPAFQPEKLTLDDLDRLYWEPDQANRSPLRLWGANVWADARSAVTFDDNADLSRENPEVEYALRFSPSIRIETTGRITALLRYAPTLAMRYGDDSRTTLDHDFAAGLRGEWSKLRFAIGQTYRRTTGSSVEFGGRVDRDIFETRANLRYRMTAKVSLAIASGLNLRSNSDGNDFSGQYVEPVLSYRLFRRWRIEAGARFGWEQISWQGDQVFQQPKLRLIADTTPRLSLAMEGGYEFRQVENGREFSAPTFQLSANYLLLPGTAVEMSGSHGLRVSDAFNNQVARSTTLRVGLRQEFPRDWQLSISAGFSLDDYENIAKGSSGNVREDDYYFVNSQLRIPIARSQSLTVYYLYRRQDSSLQSVGFSNNQCGLIWSFAF